jgi:hypothetical protein
MRFPLGRVAALAILVCLGGVAQNKRVDSRNQHERLIAIVPMIGSGTMEDPKRPMFAPVPGHVAADSTTDIIAFHFLPGDDGNFAIVEFIARDQAAFQPVLNSTDPRVRVFQRGKVARLALLLALRKIRKDFDLDSFGEVVVP